MSAELRALAEKYREMIALRRDDGPKDEARLSALARRFPGALRELDTRTMESIELRLVELEAAIDGGVEPIWASLQIRFHGWLRIALRIRAEGVRDLETARAWARAYSPREPGDPSSEALDDARLMQLIQPPHGRVSLAARAALDAGEIDLDVLLFGVRR